MKVYISADIEGITGVVAWSQCGANTANHYDFAMARRRMTADVNAAIRGARTAGATEIMVKDSHGNSKSLLVEELEPGVQLISGFAAHKDGMMAGIDDKFHAAMLIGYHAMAGTKAGIMEHTISGGVHRMWINDMPAGEIALSAAVAGAYGVPIVTISSDQAGCDEAETLIAGIATTAVKAGLGRYMGVLQHPTVTGPNIEAAAADGLRRRAQIRPWQPTNPVLLRIEFARSELADSASRLIGVNRLDAYSLSYEAGSALEMHQAARQMIAMAGLGIQAND